MELKEGIVVKAYDKGEDSEIVKLVTKEGIVSGIAKGSKKLTSKTRLYTFPFVRINFSLNNNYLGSCEVLDYHYNIRFDQKKLASGLKILEICDVLGEHVESYSLFYPFLVAILDRIEKEADAIGYELIFRLKMLYLLGVAPVFNSCVVCGRKDHLQGFCIADGGMKCAFCSNPADLYCDQEMIKVAKALYLSKLTPDFSFPDLNLNSDYQKLDRFLNTYYEDYLGFKSKLVKIF